MKTLLKEEVLPGLVTMGLTPKEASCYLALVSNGSLSANEIGKETKMFSNAVYRLIKRLSNKGFVVSLDTHPVTFQAIPPRVAVEAYIQKQEQSLEKAKLLSLQAFSRKLPKAPETRIDVIASRQNMFAAYVELIQEAKKEVLIVSVGEPVPDALKLANRDALDRGVAMKFIVHQRNGQNKELLRSWARMGMDIRYYPDSGFHLMVFDSKQSILSASNQQNLAERTSMRIYSPGLSHALRDYFYSVWEKAMVVRP